MPHTPRPNLWLRLPLWSRWAVSLIAAVVLIVVLISFVNHNNNDNLATVSPAANARANREAEIVVAQDQAPHVVKLDAGISAKVAFTRAIRNAMNGLLRTGSIDGPLNGVSCNRAGSSGGRGGRATYHCTGKADEISYPFVGVIDDRTRQLTYCKRDPPPVPSQNIPLSRRCLS